MRLNNIIESLNQAITDERNENPDKKSISTYVVVNGYEVSVEMDMYFNKSVSVVSLYSDRDHDYTNVERYISENTIIWTESDPRMETIWTLNGFADESDFLRYKYG